MTNKRKGIVYILLLLLMFVLFPQKVLAADSQLDVEISTDKKEYQIGEEIIYTISVENNTNYDGKNLSVIAKMPHNIEVKKSDTVFNKDNILSGQKYTFSVKGKVLQNSGYADVDGETSIRTDKKPAGVDTGDNLNLDIYFILIGICLLVIIFVLCIGKTRKRNNGLFIVFFLALSMIMIDAKTVKAGEINSNEVKHCTEHSYNVSGNKQTITVETKVTFVTEELGAGNIIFNNPVDSYNVYMTKDENIVISGKAEDPDGIEKIRYSIDDFSGEVSEGVAEGTEEWNFQFESEIGSSDVTVECIDKKGNITAATIKTNRLNKELHLTEQTWQLTDREAHEFSMSYVDSFLIGEETEDIADDGMYIIMDEQSEFIENLKNANIIPNIGTIILIPPNDEFQMGFSGAIMEELEISSIQFPEDYVYPEGIDTYPDNEYEVIFVQTPSFGDMIKDDISVAYNGQSGEPELAFAIMPDGTAIPGEDLDNTRAVLLSDDDKYTMRDLLPSLSSKNGFITLGWKDTVLYDGDKKKSTENDRVTFTGNIGIGNFDFNRIGIEWKPSLSDILPRQIHAEVSYDYKASSAIAVGGSLGNLKSLVKKTNQFLNGNFKNKISQKIGKLGALEIEGVAMDKEIYLCTIGIQLGTGISTVDTLNNFSARSWAAPVILVSLVVDVEGEIKAYTSCSYEYSSYNECMFNYQKAGYNGSYGTVDDNRGNNVHIRLPQNRYLDSSLYIGKNKKNKYENPTSKTIIKAEGEGKVTIGAGGNIGFMYLGIVPAYFGASYDGTALATGKLEAVFEEGKQPEYIAEGSLKYEEGIFGKVALRAKASLFHLPEIKADYYNKWQLIKIRNLKLEGDALTQVTGNVYDKNNELYIAEGIELSLKQETKEYKASLNEGKFDFGRVKPGKYVLRLQDIESGEILYTEEVVIPEQKTYELSIKLPNENQPEEGKTIVVNAGESYRVRAKEGYQLRRIYAEGTVYDYAIYGQQNGFMYNEKVDEEVWSSESLEQNDYIDITVKQGTIELFAVADQTINENLPENIIDIREKFEVNKIEHEALQVYTLGAGEMKIFDGINLGLLDIVDIGMYGQDVTGTRELYEYPPLDAVHTYELGPIENGWTFMGYQQKLTITVTSGNLVLCLRNDDVPKLVIK